jgi:hypothetical protein
MLKEMGTPSNDFIPSLIMELGLVHAHFMGNKKDNII